MTARRYRIVVCRGPECGERRESATLHGEILRQVAALGLSAQVEIGWQSCFGRCRQGPNVLVRPIVAAPPGRPAPLLATLPVGAGAALYGGVLAEDVVRILQTHVTSGNIVRDLVLKPEQPLPDRGARHQNEPDRSTAEPKERGSGESK